ncbi:hypothetical protein ACOME3_009012 [Neoechinorhynchus agilis]
MKRCIGSVGDGSDIDGDRMIREGRAVCALGGGVFYNKVQALNRDLSIIFLNVVLHESGSVRLLEAFGATGLRSIRYALELTNKQVAITTNDIDQSAVLNIVENLKRNDCSENSTIKSCSVKVTCQNAERAIFADSNDERYHVIDIDPYGSASPFMDFAVRSLSLSRAAPGILMVTSTDAIVLCGHNVASCLSRYGSTTIHGLASCHELALRILLYPLEITDTYSLQSSASKAGRYIQPVLSLHIDFYFRLFVQVYRGSLKCSDSMSSRTGYLLVCQRCAWYATSPLVDKSQSENDRLKAPTTPKPNKCPICHYELKMVGPIWTGQLHDVQLLDKMISSVELSDNEQFGSSLGRIKGALNLARQELQESILFFNPSKMFKLIGSPAISPKKLKRTMLNLGFKVSSTHCGREGIKTNAPMDVVWDVVIALSRAQTSTNKAAAKPLLEALKMRKPLNLPANDHEDWISEVEHASEFWDNPEPHWGPKKKAKISPTNK